MFMVPVMILFICGDQGAGQGFKWKDMIEIVHD